MCTLQLNGPQLAVGGLFSPRSKTPGTQLLRTETAKRSDTPRWKMGQAQFRHCIEENPSACLEVSVLTSRLLGAELLGRTHIELAVLLSEAKTDKWYPVKAKNNQETGNVRLQMAGGRSGASGGEQSWGGANNSPAQNSYRDIPMAHPRNSLMYLQNNPPPGTPGGIPSPGTMGGQRPRPAGRGAPPPVQMPHRKNGSSGDLPDPPDKGGPPLQSPGRGVAGGGPIGNFPGFNPYGGGGKKQEKGQGAAFQYKCGDMVGKGAFGKVYQALNLNSGELMAVKVLCNK